MLIAFVLDDDRFSVSCCLGAAPALNPILLRGFHLQLFCLTVSPSTISTNRIRPDTSARIGVRCGSHLNSVTPALTFWPSSTRYGTVRHFELVKLSVFGVENAISPLRLSATTSAHAVFLLDGQLHLCRDTESCPCGWLLFALKNGSGGDAVRYEMSSASTGFRVHRLTVRR